MLRVYITVKKDFIRDLLNEYPFITEQAELQKIFCSTYYCEYVCLPRDKIPFVAYFVAK